MNRPTCLIIQSGAMGDIFVVAPIAKYYYDKGYGIFWPVREQYLNLVRNYFPYVEVTGPIEGYGYPKRHDDWLRSDTMNLEIMTRTFHYDLVLNLADRGPTPMQAPDETFEEYKYRAANVPFAFKNHFVWDRNEIKENDLVRKAFNLHPEDEFVVAHLESSHGDKAVIPKEEKRPVIEIKPIEGFEIVDWFPIIQNASAVYCVESSVHQFIDGCIHRLIADDPDKQFYLLSRSSLAAGERYTVSKHWDKRFMI